MTSATGVGRLKGKIAIITGAASGQGLAEAKLFASEGATVVATDLDRERLERSMSAISGMVTGQKHDVSRAGDWNALVELTLERFGRVDILVNNAGIFLPEALPNTTDANWEQHLAVNQTSIFYGMRAVIEPMRTSGGGSIINTSSVAAIRTRPGGFAYTTTKWAVRGMTHSAARDLGRYGIRVNSLNPGLIDTDMIGFMDDQDRARFVRDIPLERIGTAKDVAFAAMFLASDDSLFVTGIDLPVDGGVSA